MEEKEVQNRQNGREERVNLPLYIQENISVGVCALTWATTEQILETWGVTILLSFQITFFFITFIISYYSLESQSHLYIPTYLIRTNSLVCIV